MNPFLSIIIPAYNEAERLPFTLADVYKHLRGENYPYEIIVVNDGSTDSTTEVVRRMMLSVPHLMLLISEKNCGKGAAVRRGMCAARGKVRLFMDADNSTSFDQFCAMRPYFEKDAAQVVIGSRTARGARLLPPQNILRRLAGKALNIFAQILLLPGVWDTQCGFKAFTASAAQEIFSRARVDGWAFDIEALALAKALGFTMKEVPVVWRNCACSHVSFFSGLRFILDNITICLELSIDAYGVRRGRANRHNNY